MGERQGWTDGYTPTTALRVDIEDYYNGAR